MKKNLLLLLVLCFASTVFVSAQKDETIFGNRGIRLTGAWGGYMQNISSFQDDLNLSRNSFFMFELNKKVLVGWDALNADFNKSTLGNLDLNSNGFILGYSPLAHKPLHPVIYLYGGKGKVKGDEILDNIYVWQPSLSVEMNVFRWFKIDLNGGYRFITESNLAGITDQELSGPYAGVKLKFGWSWGR